MDLLLANPAGLWALAGVPVVLAIHLLQRKSRRIRTSTLFLLENLTPVSVGGRRIERLRNSIPLWLQLLAVLLATWLLVQPKWLSRDSAQTIAVVLDSSVSMRAFHARMLDALRKRLPDLGSAAGRTDWILLESDPARPTLYSGARIEDLLARAAEWQPNLGTHDPTSALAVGRSLAGRGGAVVFVTDRPPPSVSGVGVLAVGKPLENVGFVGVRVENSEWTALVKNHGAAARTCGWSAEAGDTRIATGTLDLESGELVSLRGTFPEGVDRCEIVLSPDEFPLDDRLPIVREQRKKLALSLPSGGEGQSFFERIAASIPDAAVVSDADPDVAFTVQDAAAPVQTAGNAVVVIGGASPSDRIASGPIVAEDHPLTERLGWQGLIIRDSPGVDAGETDDVLLWQGERPLVLLRRNGNSSVLILNFDLSQSNADRLPAFVVLLSRFVDLVRTGKPAFERLNLETNQVLATSYGSGALEVRGADGAGGLLRAPASPGFLSVSDSTGPRLEAAAHFADAREADFLDAEAADTTLDLEREILERNSREPLLTPLWAVLLAGVCLANWAFTGRRPPSS